MICFRWGKPSEKVMDGTISIEDGLVEDLPYVGPMMKEQLNGDGIETIIDLLEEFSSVPAMSANNIESRLMHLCRNPVGRNRCARANNGQNNLSVPYQVSDVMQYTFNNILELLRFAHSHRAEFGVPDDVNIPRATRVSYRQRGTGGLAVRQCACKSTRASCMANESCQWTSAAAARLNRGVCTPRVGRPRRTSGFKGRRAQSASAQYLGNVANNDDHAIVNGDIYVKGWRVVGRVMPARRSARLSRRRRRSREEFLKASVLALEGGEKDVELRRALNKVLQKE